MNIAYNSEPIPPTERQIEMRARANDQITRIPGVTPMLRRPRGHVGKWDPAAPKEYFPRPRVLSASINHRTGKPHEHRREKARRIRNGVAPDPIF